MPDVNPWPLTDFAPTNPDTRLSLIALTKIRLRFGADSDVERMLFTPLLSGVPTGNTERNRRYRNRSRT